MSNPIALTQHQQIQAQIMELQQALLTANPLMPQLLRTIHKALENDHETVTLLSNEERATVIAALMNQTNTTVVATLNKKPGKALKSTALEDI